MSGAPKLPAAAHELAPHRPPMLLIERFIEFGGGKGVSEACFSPGSLFVDDAGEVEATAMAELIAQTYAAARSYQDLEEGKPISTGFLVGISKMDILGKAHAGQVLRVSVKTTVTVGDFSIAEGEVQCDGQSVATGTIKVWLESEQDPLS